MATLSTTIPTLQVLILSKLDVDQARFVLDLGVEDIMFAHLNPNVQTKIMGYSFVTNGSRFLKYSFAGYNQDNNHCECIFTYNNDNINQYDEHEGAYPEDIKWRKYCGSVYSTEQMYTSTNTGEYTLFKDYKIYRQIEMKYITEQCKVPHWIRHGKFSQYYSNGELEIKGQYVDNLMHGEWIRYYRNDESTSHHKLMLTYDFERGQQSGWQKGFFTNGKGVFRGFYKNWVPHDFTRRVDHPEYDTYYVGSAIEKIDWSLDGQEVTPNDKNIDITLPDIFGPVDFPRMRTTSMYPLD